MGYTYKRGRIWWIAYGKNGVHKESAETESKEEAVRLLQLRQGNIVRGLPVPDPSLKKLTVADILNDFIEHQRMVEAKSVEHVKRYYVDGMLIPPLGGTEVRALTTAMAEKAIRQMQK